MREAAFEEIDFQDASAVLAPRLRELIQSVMLSLPAVQSRKDVNEAAF